MAGREGKKGREEKKYDSAAENDMEIRNEEKMMMTRRNEHGGIGRITGRKDGRKKTGMLG